MSRLRCQTGLSRTPGGVEYRAVEVVAVISGNELEEKRLDVDELIGTEEGREKAETKAGLGGNRTRLDSRRRRNFVLKIRWTTYGQQFINDHNRIKIAREESMELSGESKPPPAVLKLKPIEATPETFIEFGQVIEASPDGEEFGPQDAQLDLSRGIPRFYIMHLKDRPFKISSITHHASVTQCLGSIGGHVWYLGVAKSSIVDLSETDKDVNAVQSRCGHCYVPPGVDDVCVFRISGPKFLKLNLGTWHAGPLFKADTMDFYNLELSNTNVVDHTTHNFSKKNGVVFLFDEY
ncbi:hypothetical protein F0562_031823 [Nyssa sinensis]|uniref:Ureidoglycolate hydrolase n=1 Tax=Nyssa sinensis TaxID=561372 RepID=A0A5J5AVQ9_9ASTE|nr:hypothetical protein F0562_031823 [Nyssa sinensis]